MKILHLSDGSLPDWRVEKSAISGLNLGHEVFFAGTARSKHYDNKTFSKIYEINWTTRAKLALPFYWHSIKKQIKNAITDVRPDIVHAHDVFAARMMLSEFKVPFVYDNHEFWSRFSYILPEMVVLAESNNKPKRSLIQLLVADMPRRAKKTARSRYAARLWSRWEKELISSGNPTITVSDKIAEELLTLGATSNKTFVVPNFPMEKEVKELQEPRFHRNLTSVYAGGDGSSSKQKRPNRNIDGLNEIFENNNIGQLLIIGWGGQPSEKVKYKGFLNRQEMLAEMSNNSVGLLPWKKHWSHYYSNPNKVYEYAHAGLFVMCTSSFETVSQTLNKENCALFDDYDDLASLLKYYKDNLDELYKKRQKIFQFARANLIWEKYEDNIAQAYQLC
jgi:glycosyltransferase involved in cell wall biosynthesis